MAWLFEDSTTVLVAAAVIEALLGVVLFRTGRGAVILAMLGVAAFAGLLFLVERVVVTPREEVEVSLVDISEAMEANDARRVMSWVDPQAAQLLDEAGGKLPQIQFKYVGIKQLEVTASGSEEQAKAVATFLCHVEAQDRGGQSPYDEFFRKLTVYFRKQGGRWLVTGYKDEDPFPGGAGGGLEQLAQ